MPAPTPRAERQHDVVLHTGGFARHALAERRAVRVVLNRGLRANASFRKTALDRRAEREAVAVFVIREPRDGFAVFRDEAGQPHAGEAFFTAFGEAHDERRCGFDERFRRARRRSRNGFRAQQLPRGFAKNLRRPQ